jgi:hypothetical protein
MTFYTNGSERVRINTAGNVGIGTSSPTATLSVNGVIDQTSQGTFSAQYRCVNTGGTFYYALDSSTGSNFGSAYAAVLWHSGNYPMLFATNNTERMRIDSSGNLLVGTTSSAEGSGVGLKLLPSATGPRYAVVGSDSSNTTIAIGVYSTGAAAYRFQVGYGGTIYATSTSISAISDQTLKENIRDLETGLREVMSLKPRRFDWINGDAKNVAGFVAQEVEQVLPELVEDYVYNKDNEGNSIIKKSLKMGDILPTLVKAIQEQQTLIEQLTQRIAALEGA